MYILYYELLTIGVVIRVHFITISMTFFTCSCIEIMSPVHIAFTPFIYQVSFLKPKPAKRPCSGIAWNEEFNLYKYQHAL